MNFKLRFDKSEVKSWAEKYVNVYLKEKSAEKAENNIINNIVPRTRAAGYLNREDFLKMCYWKTPRSKNRCEKNDDEFVREVTRIALSTPSERLRIEVLRLLSGVDWPTASVILHFCHKDPYPILDYRALRSLGCKTPPKVYDFQFWTDYTDRCRKLAQELGVGMRELDRALWAYDKSLEKNKE